MGVPKFYRWISERYPCLSQVVKEHQIPEFDNLYLDMNGIIHTCSHPNDDDPHFRITEEKIFKDIFHYIEFLYRMIKPRKVFFMAVDGVAPRAKMNQQRGRRFRSAKEAEEVEKRAREKGEILPTEARFDSNCITPGTEFMARLHEQLKYFISMKISTDEMWQGVDIYLSGHETPGEGEHKIMDFIRYTRSQEGYDPNTRHCLYGLDADLIMLGLCSHEPHFSLLREEVKFGRRKSTKHSSSRVITPEQTTFHLLHLSLLRDYLDHEFSTLKSTMTFPYNLENIIDDWVLMGFLVGNDFIPNLPHFHIQHDALPMLYKVYIECLPSLGGYINENGYLNMERFEKYVKKLSQIDYDKFNDTFADLKYFQSKTGRRMGQRNSSSNNDVFLSPSKLEEHWRSRKQTTMMHSEESNLIELFGPSNDSKVVNPVDDDDDDDMYEDVDTEDEGDFDDNDDDTDEQDLFELEFKQHKRDYYMNKLDYANVTPEVLKDQAYGYVRAIQWNLHYYYNGVASWSWYYPHHYAPYISDVKDFSGLELKFELGKPFLPFQQLLAVLPSASKQLLPNAYQKLMTDANSPIKEYYPVDFATDLNGKQQEWEAVVLIPFIEVESLLGAVEPLDGVLTAEERARNKHGPHLLYQYSKQPLGRYATSLPGIFPDIEFNHAICREVDENYFRLPAEKIKKGLLDGVDLEVYFPGFPTLGHVPHSAQLKKMKVKVFQYPSRGENMILTIDNKENQDLRNIANDYLGKDVFINWPHLEEAKVVELSDGDTKYYLEDKSGSKKPAQKNIISSNMTQSDQSLWRTQALSVKERYLERFGIDVGDIDILVFAVPLIGRKYIAGVGRRITAEKQFSIYPVTSVLQLVVKDIAVQDRSFREFRTVSDLYVVGSKCFMLGNPHYGCMGEVVSVLSDGRVKAKFQVPSEPKLKRVIKNQRAISSERYIPGYAAAQRLGISSFLLSRITGAFFIQTGNPESMSPGRVNIGLNLKFNNKNEEVPGYTKKIDDMWLYSDKAIKLMDEYLRRFPEMFENLQNHLRDDAIHVSKIFPGEDYKGKLQEVLNWIKNLECTEIERQKCGAITLDEAVIEAIEEAVAKNQEQSQNVKCQTMTTKPHLLYCASHFHGNVPADPGVTFNLFDRVVNVREGYSVPLGLRGTIIGIHSGEKETDTMYDVLFDKEFAGGLAIRCSPGKGYQLPPWALLNITFGARQLQKAIPAIDKTESSLQPGFPRYNYAPTAKAPSAAASKKGSADNISGYSSSYVDPSITWSSLSPHSMPRVPAHCSFIPPRLYQAQYDTDKGKSWRLPQGKSPPCPNNSSSNSPVSPALNLKSPVRFNHSPNSPFVERQQESEFNAIWEGLKNVSFGSSQGDLPTRQHFSESQATDLAAAPPIMGKSLPVETLFEVARNAEQSAVSLSMVAEPQNISKNDTYYPNTKQTLGISKPFFQSVSPSICQSQMTQNGPRADGILLQYCQQNFKSNPIYEFTKSGPMQMYQAKLILPNKRAFYSVPMKTPQDAYENAAEAALRHLNVNLPSPSQNGPPLVADGNLTHLFSAGSVPKFHAPRQVLFPNQMRAHSPKLTNSFNAEQPDIDSSNVSDIPSSYVSYNRQLLQKSELDVSDNMLHTVDGVVQPYDGGTGEQDYRYSQKKQTGVSKGRVSPKKASRDTGGGRREWVNSGWKAKTNGSSSSNAEVANAWPQLSSRGRQNNWLNDSRHGPNHSVSNTVLPNRRFSPSRRNKSLNIDFQYPVMEKTNCPGETKWQNENSKANQRHKSEKPTTSRSNPFVPLQVTQKQKHHQVSNSTKQQAKLLNVMDKHGETIDRTEASIELSRASSIQERRDDGQSGTLVSSSNSKVNTESGKQHVQGNRFGKPSRKSRLAARFSNT